MTSLNAILIPVAAALLGVNALDWVLANGTTIAGILLGLHGVAVLIVNLTPTPKDDKIVGKLYKPIEWLAGVLTKKAKERSNGSDDSGDPKRPA